MGDSSISTTKGQGGVQASSQSETGKVLSKYMSSYRGDTQLLRRVDKYLDDKMDEEVIDKENMVEDLRLQYREYGRRNKAAFRAAVFKAFNVVMEASLMRESEDRSSVDLDSSDGSVEDVFYEDDGVLETAPAVTTTEALAKANNGAVSYMKQIQKMMNPNIRVTATSPTSQELINISSDDEEKEDSQPKKTVPRTLTKPAIIDRRLNISVPKVNIPYGTRIMTPTVPMETIITRKRKMGNETLVPPLMKRQKLTPTSIPTLRFRDFGGNVAVLKSVAQLVLHLRHPAIYQRLGVAPPRGFLLHGPPGSGKTLLAHVIAGELKVPLLKVAAPELVAGVSGESEQRVRDLFDQATAQAPCIVFIDEVDAITSRRDTAQKDMERRIVSQLLSCLDDLSTKKEGNRVLVIGATNRPDSIDPAMRRAGRFDREVSLGIPDRAARKCILQLLCAKLRLHSSMSLEQIAALTPGYVGADLKSLVSEAAIAAVNRIIKELRVQRNASELKNKRLLLGEIYIELVGKESENKGEQAAMEMETGGEQLIVTPIVKKKNNKQEANSEDSSIKKEVDESEKTAEVSDEKMEVVEDKKEAEDDEEAKEEVAKELKEGEAEVKTDEAKSEAGGSSTTQAPSNGLKKDCLKVPMKDRNQCLSDLTADEPENLIQFGPQLTSQQLDSLFIELDDFLVALKNVQPSAKREGFVTVPDVTWDDIGSLQDIRNELQMSIMMPVKYPEEFAKLGVTSPTGILLCGPPGCGKTLLAKAVANEANINFISVKGPELLNMYVGESERAVRQCFQRARNSHPCVIFFDELDALCPKRSDSIEGSASSRVVNQLLTEMDGVEGRTGVFLMAATNRPDMVDPAVMRPGRFDKILYVGLPSAEDRVDILRALTKNGAKPPLDGDVDLREVARSKDCSGYTGADLAALIKEASVQALTEYIGRSSEGELVVRKSHITQAVRQIRPSVSEKDRKRYDSLRVKYSAPGTVENEDL